MSEAQVLPVHPLWTFADLEELPDDGYRYEIIDGSLHVSPPPTPGTRASRICSACICRRRYLIT
jgi:hypothetical protein